MAAPREKGHLQVPVAGAVMEPSDADRLNSQILTAPPGIRAGLWKAPAAMSFTPVRVPAVIAVVAPG